MFLVPDDKSRSAEAELAATVGVSWFCLNKANDFGMPEKYYRLAAVRCLSDSV